MSHIDLFGSSSGDKEERDQLLAKSQVYICRPTTSLKMRSMKCFVLNYWEEFDYTIDNVDDNYDCNDDECDILFFKWLTEKKSKDQISNRY